MPEWAESSSDEEEELLIAPDAPPGRGAGASAGAHVCAPPPSAAAAAVAAKLARPPSFAAHSAAQGSLQWDALRLLALAAVPLLGLLKALVRRAWSPGLWMGAVQVGAALACMVALVRTPAAYKRQSNSVSLLMHALLLGSDVGAAAWHRGACFVGSPDRGDLAAATSWLVCLVALSGARSGVLALLLSKQPPVTMAASSLAWAAATSARGPRLCSTCLQHSGSHQRMEVAYRLLAPLSAALEPLLLAVGVARGHPRRHCHCVLAVLQFWLAGLLPLVLASVHQVRAYKAWRAEERRLNRERRHQQAEEWGFGFRETSGRSTAPASSESSGSSPCSQRGGNGTFGQPLGMGGSVAGADPTAHLSDPLAIAQLSALLPLRGMAEQHRWQVRWARRRRGRPSHPDDWQWVWAGRVLHALRPSITTTALAAFVATLAAAWHRITFL